MSTKPTISENTENSQTSKNDLTVEKNLSIVNTQPSPDNIQSPKNIHISLLLTTLSTLNITLPPYLHLTSLPNRGISLLTTRSIEPNTDLFTIPHSSILSPLTSSIPKPLLRNTTPWIGLILTLLYEISHSSGRWGGYLSLLPREFDTLIFWSADELELLAGSAIVGKIGRGDADETFRREILPVIRGNEGVFGCEGAGEGEVMGRCHWAGSLIMAYAFDLPFSTSPSSGDDEGNDSIHSDDEGDKEGEQADPGPSSSSPSSSSSSLSSGEEEQNTLKAIIPLADLLNSDASPNARLFSESKKLVMRSTAPIVAGDEILNDYGAMPTSEVLRRYGYTTPQYRPFDVVEVSLDLITKNVDLPEWEVEGRVGFLEGQDILEEGFLLYRPDSEEGMVSDDLGVLVNTLALSQGELERFRRKGRLPKPAPLSGEGVRLLRRVVTERLGMYPLQHLLDVEDKWKGNRRYDMARMVIEGEVSLLEEVKEELDRMGRDDPPPGEKRKNNPPSREKKKKQKK